MLSILAAVSKDNLKSSSVFAAMSLAAATVFALTGTVRAATPAESCSSSKLKATGKMVQIALSCHAKAAKKGEAVDAACLAKASTKLESGFDKAEGKGGCTTTGDSGALTSTADGYVDDVTTAITDAGDTASRKCSSSKRKAAGKKAAAELKCYSKSAKKSEVVDPACIAKAESKMTSAFDKAESKGGCATIDDEAAICTTTDAATEAVVAQLVALCGDDIAGPGEECDGTDDSSCPGLCDVDCTCLTDCGNNIQEGPEECDGTDDAACPGMCLSSCICPGDCGNGTIDGEEECDDGGNVSGDGCRDDCQLEDTSAVCAGVPTTSGTSLTTQLVGNFTSPVHVTAPPLDPSRVFVVELPGVIRVVKNGSVLPTPFLDIQSDVNLDFESGLLSLAFHPDYETNGRFFVNYSRESDNATVISRFEVSANPDVADASSEQVLFTITQPFLNHNGGQIAFSPIDGYLYVGMGDGGSGGDPLEAGQDDSTLLGKMLRVDVDVETPPHYAIPASNPNAGAGLPLGLIWAKGLRNPWRFSFDRTNGDLFIGDVGQDAIEEVNYTPGTSTGGENYGWDDMEGTACYEPSVGCLTAGRQLPIVEYLQAGNGCSVTGGHIYRGCALPDIDGTYFYADYCTNFIRTFEVLAGAAVNEQDLTSSVGTFGNVSSFGEDARGEIYIANLNGGGGVYKIVAGP